MPHALCLPSWSLRRLPSAALPFIATRPLLSLLTSLPTYLPLSAILSGWVEPGGTVRWAHCVEVCGAAARPPHSRHY